MILPGITTKYDQARSWYSTIGTWRSWKMEIPSTQEVQSSKIANQISKSHHNPRLLSNKVVQIEECSANTWMSIMHPWLAAPQATHDNEEPTTTSFYSSSSGLQVPQHSCYWRLVLMFLLSLISMYDLKLPIINPRASKSSNGNWCLMFNVSVISIVLFRLQ